MRDLPKVLAGGCGLLFTLCGPACRRETTPPVVVIDARDHAVAAPIAPIAPPPAPMPMPMPTAAAAAAAESEDAAVEISGEIELPPGPAPAARIMIYVAAGDCLNDAAPLLRRLPASDNRTFFGVVTAHRSSQLSICAAAEPGPGKPAHLYGRAEDPLRIDRQATADPSFHDIKVTLREGPPHRFATQETR
jgi:hypothetical protein